jgi:phage terminase small subunit
VGLTNKQEQFVQGLVSGLTQRKAYEKAYDTSKMNAKTIDKRASELFNKREVKGRYEELNQKVIAKMEETTLVTKERIIKELAAIAFANGADYARVVNKVMRKGKKEIHYQDVELIPTDELSEEKKRAISGIKATKTGIEVKTHDKVKALELLGTHLGMWEKTNEVEKSTTEKLDQIFRSLDAQAAEKGGG